MELKIIGCKGKINDVEQTLRKIEAYSSQYKIAIQAVNPNHIYGTEHIESAVNHALRALREKRNISNSLPMEILLYAAGKKQVREAIEFMGIKKQGNAALICVGNTTLTGFTNPIPKNLNDFLNMAS